MSGVIDNAATTTKWLKFHLARPRFFFGWCAFVEQFFRRLYGSDWIGLELELG